MAAGLGAKELFSYNRENFKFDQDQRIEREALRLEMQVKRFELFREDVRDLVELTVDRMDVYHLVGALFLEFCIVLFCEGRVQASAPPFLLSLFLLSNACAFIYLLLAVWLSMHASIASHSFGVRLLTRFVRLPIPSMKQIAGLRSTLKDYERQGVANLLRLPFQDQQEWQQVHGVDGESKAPIDADSSAQVSQATPSAPSSLGPKPVKERSASPQAPRAPGPTTLGKPLDGQAKSGANLLHSGQNLLPEQDETVIGGEDLLTCSHGAQPERHVQLFRQLQSKWQCYDAYCRVCMGLGVNQILQGLSYYCICHTLVENHSPTTGYALVTLFQSTTIALAVLDLAGLRRREILAVQVVGIMPCLLTAWGVAHGHRIEGGVLDPAQTYMLSPLSFLCQVLWLELWLRVAAPHGDDQAKLPRRFRQVLFLDVFGDSSGDISHNSDNNCEDDMIEGEMFKQLGVKEEDKDADDEALIAAAQRAASQLTMAQCGVRRWSAAPSWALSRQQHKDLETLRDQLTNWSSTICTELERCCRLPGIPEALRNMEKTLRPWSDLSSEEQSADPFAGCLVGPFEHDDGYKTACYHFEIESQRTLFEDAARQCPGALVLSLQAVSALLKDLEESARRLLELRIMSDLRITMQRRRLQSELKSSRKPKRPSIRAQPPAHDGRVHGNFPNLVALFNTRLHQRRLDQEAHVELLRVDSPRSEEVPETASESSHIPMAGERGDRGDRPDPDQSDPTLVAMAGANARHFVPEKLPWQVLRNITRVLQVCWLWSGIMAFLKEVHIYQVDFQQHPASERRLCEAGTCAASVWSFSKMDVDWPHGTFFRPQGIFCANHFFVASPFALYQGQQSAHVQLKEVQRVSLPHAVSAACRPGVDISECLLIAPAKEGLQIWNSASRGRTVARLDEAWHVAAGSTVPCEQVLQLLPPDEIGLAEWCLLLAGWDGRRVPIAAVPLIHGASLPPDTSVQPGLDVPLQEDAKDLVAMHIDSNGNLVAIMSGYLEVWDLFASRSLGRWRPRWPESFKPVGICQDASVGFMVVGHDVDRGGASMSHSHSIPWNTSFQSV